MAKFLYPTATPDINAKIVGFVSDQLYPVLIQEKKEWDLEKLSVFANGTVMTHY